MGHPLQELQHTRNLTISHDSVHLGYGIKCQEV